MSGIEHTNLRVRVTTNCLVSDRLTTPTDLTPVGLFSLIISGLMLDRAVELLGGALAALAILDAQTRSFSFSFHEIAAQPEPRRRRSSNCTLSSAPATTRSGGR
jgi:hypothetical protein